MGLASGILNYIWVEWVIIDFKIEGIILIIWSFIEGQGEYDI